MSSVSPVGLQPPTQVSGVEPVTMTSAPPVGYLQGTLDGVANLLSLSPSGLRTALKQGSSISDIAAQKGVSRAVIVHGIAQQVQQQRASQSKPPIDTQVLDQVVNRAVDRHRHGHAHRGVAAAAWGAAQATPTQVAPAGRSSLDVLA